LTDIYEILDRRLYKKETTPLPPTSSILTTASELNPEQIGVGTIYSDITTAGDVIMEGETTIEDPTGLALTDGKIYVGNASNLATAVLMSGDATISNTGVLTISAGAITLTTDVSGTLPVANGGTGATTLTGLLQGNGTSAITVISNSSTVGQVLRVTGASTYAWGALDLADSDAITGVLPITNGGTGGATGASAISKSVAQSSHGFAVGDVIKNSGSANTYAKAQANSAANAEVVGIVSTVTDTNNFIFTMAGIVTSGVPAQAAGTVMFLDPTTAGALTTTEPTTAGQVSKPLVVIIENAVSMVFINYRGIVN